MSKIIQEGKSKSRDTIIQRVYAAIRKNSGKVRSADLHRLIGDKEDVRYAVSRLTNAGKIKRMRGLGEKGVEYFYHDVQSWEFLKKMNVGR
jgi:predicted transcriptional regulator